MSTRSQSVLLAGGIAAVSSLFTLSAANAMPIVSGNTVTLPSGGWIEVQDSTSYATICEGSGSCTVSPDTYTVINHTNGEKFFDIAVGGSNVTPVTSTGTTNTVSGVSIVGNAISWPDNGWYQVQNATSFESVCEGGLGCSVAAGVYHVINHTTGERNEFLSVGEVTPVSTTTTTPVSTTTTTTPVSTGTTSNQILNSSNALDIWREVVALINEDKIDAFFDAAGVDLDVRIAPLLFVNTGNPAYIDSGTVTVNPAYTYNNEYRSTQPESINTASSYACAAGGSVLVYAGGVIKGADSVFDSCSVGGAIYSGTAGTRNVFRGAISRAPFSNFSRTASNGDTTRLSGNFYSGNQSFVVTNAVLGWDYLDYRESTSEGELRLSDYRIDRTIIDTELDNGSYGFGTAPDGTQFRLNPFRLENTINGRFNVRAPWTGTSSALSVTVDLSYEDTALFAMNNRELQFPERDPVQPFNWEAGSVVITAVDGSRLSITPSASNIGSFELSLNNGDIIGPLPWVGEYEID